MAVPEQTPYIEHVANGVTTSFSLGFVCDSADKLVVTINDLPTNVGEWSFSDGNVVFQYPPLSESIIKIWRNSPLARSTTFKTYDNSLNPNSLNLDLDKIWLVMQELNVKNFISDNKLQEILDSLIAGNVHGLPAEILARIAGDESIKSLVNLEAIRAYQAESNLNIRIDNESLLANQNILAEKQRAEAAEQGLQIQVNSVGVGNKAYKTYALMDADKVNIPAKSKVTVTNDETASNNGDWQWDGVAFTKSAYDPLTQAKNHSDAKTFISPSENILELRDLYEKLIVLMRGNGDLYIPNLDKSVQSFLKTLEIDIDDVKLRLNYDESTSMINAVDKNSKLVFSITKSGSLHIHDVVTQNGSVEKRLKYLEENSTSDTAVEILKSTDYAIATRDDAALLNNTMLFSLEELSVSYVFASSICRLSKREFLVFCEGRLGGDFDAAKLFMRKVTVNNDYSLTLGAVSIVADSGGVDLEAFSCINSCSLKVETGVHAGRVYLYYIKRFYNDDRDETYQIYSDDNGVTWSAPIDMSVFMPNFANWRVVAVGPGKAIQLKRGAHTGRIVLPCWHADLNYPSSTAGLKSFILYSDDGGVTYAVGAESEVAGSNECQVAETVNGDIALLIRDGSQYKSISMSTDGGLTLHSTRILTEITTTRVQSSICQFKNSFDLSVPKLVVCTPSVFGVREDLGLFVSYDEKTFALWKVITDGLSSYSDIMPIDESHILVTYSAGRVDANRDIKAIVVNLKSILLGA